MMWRLLLLLCSAPCAVVVVRGRTVGRPRPELVFGARKGVSLAVGTRTGSTSTLSRQTPGSTSLKTDAKPNATAISSRFRKLRRIRTGSEVKFNASGSSSRVLSGPHTIMGITSTGTKTYLYLSTLGNVGVSPKVEGDESKWTVTAKMIAGGNRAVLANVKWPHEHLTVEYNDETNMGGHDYFGGTCSTDDLGGCWDTFEIYEPTNAEDDQAGGVLLGGKVGVPGGFEVKYLEIGATHYCPATSTPRKSGLWFFEPPLDSGAIFGTKELEAECKGLFCR